MRVMPVPSTTDGAATSAHRRSAIPRLRQPYQLARKPAIMPPYATRPPCQTRNISSGLCASESVMYHSSRDPMIDQTAVHM